MNKSSFIESRFFSLMDVSFSLIKSSLLFWWYVLKNFFIFGFTSSFCTLIEVVGEVSSGNGKPVKMLFREIFPKYKGYSKVSSAVFIGFVIYFTAFIVLPFPDAVSPFYSSVIKFACIYALLLGLVVYTYMCWNIVKKGDRGVKASLFLGFYLLIKKFFRSLLILLSLVAVCYVSDANFIFLLFFAPGIYAWLAKNILGRMTV
ncbi:hypothetical protein [Fictibacillus fluitans]|uniref:DUF624 domain-containing protein n=1 Tax=Fictibacillus fluitans TaxID=3058422 RepID=A0ABT8I1T3_9BACL|nr:hypothetical protein [Fictibacillus sp. NE201]MDN4526670.1 hypothetical protein [Fictibacillus sp. NE201]